MELLPCATLEPEGEADAAVIWLHGLGADGHDFEPLVPELRLPDGFAARFVFPHAPARPVTINNGQVMPAWYDIRSLEIESEVDYEQIAVSCGQIEALVETEIGRGINSERIVLAGVSQGGVIAYGVGLSFARKLAGVMALSSYLPDADKITFGAANAGTPVAIFHGVYDPVVPEALGQKAWRLLSGRGYRADYKTYPMQHGVCAEEVADMSRWLQQVLG